MARAPVSSAPLPYTVLTVDEAAEIVDRWQRLAAQFAGTGASWTATAKTALPAAEYQAVTDYLQKTSVALEDATSVSQALTKLHAQTAALPLIDLELAWSPSQAFLDELIAWFRKYGPGASRLRIHQNSDLVGGLMVGYAGRVLDYSLATRLDAYEDQLRRQS